MMFITSICLTTCGGHETVFNTVQPKLVIVMETELAMIMITELPAGKIPLVIANACLSSALGRRL